MIFTKGAHENAKFQKHFDCSGEISPNSYFDRLKYIEFWIKMYRGVTYLTILKIDAKFEEKPICCFKNDKNLVSFYPSTQKSQIFAL